MPPKSTISRQFITDRLMDLLDKASQLPEHKQDTKLFHLILSVYKELGELHGLKNHDRHTSTDINVTVTPWQQMLPSVPTKLLEEGPFIDPSQTAMDFDALPPARYTLDELINPEPDQEASPPSISPDL